jgi:uncharacterized protein (TIGR02996 family)
MQVQMSDDEPFLRAILDRPDDLGPRRVYADWLEEHGECARAEFLRSDCERLATPRKDPEYRKATRRAIRVFLAHGQTWARPALWLSADTIAAKSDVVAALAPLCRIVADLKGCRPGAVSQFVPESVARENAIVPLGLSTTANYLVDPFPLSERVQEGRYYSPGNQILIIAGEVDVTSELAQKLGFILAVDVVWVEAGPAQIAVALDRLYGSAESESVETID